MNFLTKYSNKSIKNSISPKKLKLDLKLKFLIEKID